MRLFDRGAAVRLLLCLAGVLPGAAFADTVASLLGNFTINQYVEVAIAPAIARVHYTVVYGQLPALRELHLADANGDGVTTQRERDDHVRRLAPDFASSMKLTVDGVALPLTPTHWTSSLPTEQGGFSMRVDVDFEAVLPAPSGIAQAVHFDNENFQGRIGWREIVIGSSAEVATFDSNGFSTSLTRGLTEALQQLPAAGPLDERVVDFRYRPGPMPAGAQAVPARGDAPVARPSSPTTDSTANDWLQRRTKELVGLISTPTVAPHVALSALFAALVLGALHAFSPGHGKTIVGAYLIGSRSTPRHAVFLGVTVTITHTLVVFALGLATLVASRFIVPERLLPALSLLSGLLVLGMGVVLLMQRWRPARNAVASAIVRRVTAALDAQKQPAADAPLAPYRRLDAAQVGPFGMSGAARQVRTAAHRHAHGPDDHAHGHSHADGHGMHSHGGGSLHSHLPPGAAGEAVTWRSLFALGVSGGLVPCPSALVLLLAAVALNKTLFGLILVVAFSAGLALTLIAVGLVFLYARSRFKRPRSTSVWPHLLPAFSALLITIVGMILCYGALTSAGTGSFAV
jgi:ABC-type nickel/cobalt efflux system permease component RcnA